MQHKRRTTIEVFFEAGCNGSTRAVNAARTAAIQTGAELRLFCRNAHRVEFLRRGILICPATFINGQLAFYGPMDAEEIIAFMHRQPVLHN